MALAGQVRWQAAEQLLQRISEAESVQRGERRQLLKEAALPVTEAVLLHGRQEYAASVNAMLPALSRMQRLGGSHAQRDVSEQLFIDAALKPGRDDVLRLHRVLHSPHIRSDRRTGGPDWLRCSGTARHVGMKLSTA